MALEEYRDPLLKKLIDMLEEQGPSELKGHYVYGDVLNPGKDELPVVSVARQGTRIRSDSNMTDAHVTAIVIAVIADWSTDLDKSFDLVRGTTQLYEWMEQRNEDYSVKEGTLVYAIRDNQKLDDNLYISINDEGLQVDYGLGWEKRGDNIFSVEGVLRFNIELTQPKTEYYPAP